MQRILLMNMLAVLLYGCGSSQQFARVPPDLNRENVPHQVIEMTAEDFHFTPDFLHVKAGTLVTLKVTSVGRTHGFNLGAFGFDERLEEHDTKVIEFYAGEKWEYGFKCAHFCGFGHFGMDGKLVVE